MKGDPIPTIDPGDFKKAWEVRFACVDAYIDVESVKPIFKPDTNVEAAISRATLLLGLTQNMPDLFVEFMNHGQPNDALLEAFAGVPLTKDADFNLTDLLEQIRKHNPCA